MKRFKSIINLTQLKIIDTRFFLRYLQKYEKSQLQYFQAYNLIQTFRANKNLTTYIPRTRKNLPVN